MRRAAIYFVVPALIAIGVGAYFTMPASRPMQDTDTHHTHTLKAEDGGRLYTNALIHETSPYLLQHAHNPVDWHPWGEEAFEIARKQQKPIFLSIGYSTCYWCHVMERQVFEDAKIAEHLNERFVCIKVDREERPDVDDIYMTATQLMTRGGGWPMSVFLTPPAPEGKEGEADFRGYGLKPFWCGTYIPPEPMYGRPSFPQVVEALHNAWEKQREDVLLQAERLAEAVEESMHAREEGGELSIEAVQRTANALLRTYDVQHGGFGGGGSGPKFPQPINLAFLLAVARNNQSRDVLDAVHHTLDRMVRGGMFDQVGGGFHRYSVDAKWLVPHFEKMLYDNGQLLSLYARALAMLREGGEGASATASQYERVLRETAEYVLREMVDGSDSGGDSGGNSGGGAFWSAQDAEVNAREGGNYVWTQQEVDDAIEEDALAGLAIKMYGLDMGPNFQDPHHPDAQPVNVLFLPQRLDELAGELGLTRADLLDRRQRINAQLKAVRDQRDQPGTDDKVLVAWNGLMIKGLAEAGAVLDEPRYVEAAARAADAIVERMGDGSDGLLRSMRNGRVAKVGGFLEDYAHLAAGLIALHRATKDGRYLDLATRYTQAAVARFAAEGGGYYDTLEGQSDLFVRVRSTYDGAMPTGASVMIHNLLDLHEITGDRAHLERAAHDLQSYAGTLHGRGMALVHMQHALLRLIETEGFASSARPDSLGQRAGASSPVTAAARWRDADTLLVRLSIAEGHHLNGHETADASLTPTTLTLDGPGELRVTYPDAETRRYPFADQPLAVYEGEVELEATLTGIDASSRLLLSYQACTDTACLTPATIPVTIPSR